MPLSSRDFEDIYRKPFKEPWFLKALAWVLRPLFKTPLFKQYVSGSAGGLSGNIFSLQRKKEYEKATKISIHALKKFRNKKIKYLHHHIWWQFMTHGVESAKHIQNDELREQLITLAETGIEPFKGYSVAYSYLEFSRWKYRTGKHEEAIRYAKVASEADDTWAEPDFLLGWYGLLLSTGSPEEHLSRAIEKDHRVLFRVANNDICKQYPHIISKLTRGVRVRCQSNHSGT